MGRKKVSKSPVGFSRKSLKKKEKREVKRKAKKAKR